MGSELVRRVKHASRTLLSLPATLGICSVVYFLDYLTFAHRPGSNPTYPDGWWGWHDQSLYRAAAAQFRNFTIESRGQAYPPLYPLLLAPFLAFSEAYGEVLLDLALYLIYLTLVYRLLESLHNTYFAGLVLCFTVAFLQPVRIQWVIPWTSSLAACLTAAVLYVGVKIYHATAERVGSNQQKTVTPVLASMFTIMCLLVGLLFPTRPSEVAPAVIMLAFTALFLIRQKNGRKILYPSKSRVGINAAVLTAPIVGYAIFNLALFGNVAGGYFDSVRRGGGADLLGAIRNAYSHIFDAQLLWGDFNNDWKSRLLIPFLCFVLLPVGLLFGKAIERVILVILCLSLVLTYSYFDATPLGQFKYHNIHYVKWLIPFLSLSILPVVRIVKPLLQSMKLPRLKESLVLLAAVVCLVIWPFWKPQLSANLVFTEIPNDATSFWFEVQRQNIDAIDLDRNREDLEIVQIVVDNKTVFPSRSGFKSIPVEGGQRIIFSSSLNVGKVEMQLASASNGVDNLGVLLRHIDYANFDLGTPASVSFPLITFDEAWSGPEGWGRWLVGLSGSLEVFVGNSCRDPVLHMELFGRVRGPSDSRKVVLSSPNMSVAPFEFEVAGNEVQVSVPLLLSASSTSGLIPVQVVVDGFVRPSDVGGSRDDRPLSIGLTSAEVRCYGQLP